MRIQLHTAAVPVVLAGVLLCLLSAPRSASADWPSLGRAICTAPNGQNHSSITTDGAGGAILTWQDLRTPRVNIFAQHVLASGDVDGAWPFDGRALLTDGASMATADGGQSFPAIVPDGAGGAIVAWLDNRSAVTETDIFAQHVLASGEVDGAWPANGVPVCAAAGVQNGQAMVPDGAGGAIVTWVDGRRGADQRDIFAQHVLASGLMDSRWPVNGLGVCTASGVQEAPVAIADGAGGAIVAWQDARSVTTGFDVFAQHVLGSGTADPAWPDGGRAVCSASGDQGFPTIVPDGAHGAVVAWSDSREVGTSHVFAQHVLGAGVVDPGWPADGRAVSNAALIETRPRAVPDGAGGAIVTWQGFTIHLNMYVEHITAAGVVDPAWPAGGRALTDTDRQQSHADVVSDDAGGAVIAWQDSFDVVAQHVLASGALDSAYPDTGRTVCALPSQQGEPALTATGGGGAIVSWTDLRGGEGSDIFALQVLAAGTTDVPLATQSGIRFAPPSPNPARGPLTLRFAVPREMRVTLAVYDVTGTRVRELASGTQATGEHVLTWDLRDESGRAVGAGLYFARLEVDGQAFTAKLATLR